jgi:hypothetical protein
VDLFCFPLFNAQVVAPRWVEFCVNSWCRRRSAALGFSNAGLLLSQVSPCACRGSLAMIHIGCLKQCHMAKKHPDSLACDTCHQPFFGKVAAELARMNVEHREKLPGGSREKVTKVQLGHTSSCGT